MDMHIIRTAALLVGGLAAGVVITNSVHSEPVQPQPIHVVEVQAPDVTPAQYLGENDPIVPLVCGVNLDCSGVDAAQAAKNAPKKSKDSRTVRTSHSSNGASSTTVTEKSAAGSSTVTHSRTAKGVTTTSRSVTTSK
jgi:hypothetical protein